MNEPTPFSLPPPARRSRAGWAIVGVLLAGLFAFMVATGHIAGGRVTTLAVIGKAARGDYWLAVKRGAYEKAAELRLKVVVVGPSSEADVAGQIRLVEDMVARGVDGIALSPCDARALSPVVARAMAEGIKVVTLDADTEAKDRLCYIGTDNRAAGRVAGEAMLNLVPPGATVGLITGGVGARNLTERQAGFAEAVGDRLVLLPPQPDHADKDRALAIAERTLAKHPEIRGFFTDTAISGPAVAQALRSHQRAGAVKLVSFDTTPVLIKHLKDDSAQVLIAQRPALMGALGVQMLAKAVNGEVLPPHVDTGVLTVTRGNVTDFEQGL